MQQFCFNRNSSGILDKKTNISQMIGTTYMVCSKGIHGRLSAGPADPGNQETSRWDLAGHADNRPWITFLTRELFIRNIFISYNK